MKKNIVETTAGTYELIKNHKEAFDIVKFQERYVEEIYDKYEYIVGDVSSEILRIKGFYAGLNKEPNIKEIPTHLNETCNYNTAYFILKRINEK
jgi:uncharacterized protein YutD